MKKLKIGQTISIADWDYQINELQLETDLTTQYFKLFQEHQIKSCNAQNRLWRNIFNTFETPKNTMYNVDWNNRKLTVVKNDIEFTKADLEIKEMELRIRRIRMELKRKGVK